ncbi:MAG: RlmE family RNA methyltransferase [Candidatus Hodarchaeales archaeon]
MKHRGKRRHERKDEYFYKMAKNEGYRARSAYKLIQMDEKFRLLKKNQVIVDLCGAPGGFSQYIRKKLGNHCQVVLVDLEKVDSIEGIFSLQLDITSGDTLIQIQKVVSEIRKDRRPVADLVVADCSPKVIGRWSTDQARQIFLCEHALAIAKGLKARIFVTKVFQGEYFNNYVATVKEIYQKVKLHKPKASRAKSAEIYLVARDFHENPNRVGKQV